MAGVVFLPQDSAETPVTEQGAEPDCEEGADDYGSMPPSPGQPSLDDDDDYHRIAELNREYTEALESGRLVGCAVQSRGVIIGNFVTPYWQTSGRRSLVDALAQQRASEFPGPAEVQVDNGLDELPADVNSQDPCDDLCECCGESGHALEGCPLALELLGIHGCIFFLSKGF